MLHSINALQVLPGETLAISTQIETIYVQRQSQQWLLSRVRHPALYCSLHSDLVIERDVKIHGDVDKSLRWSSGEQESTLRIVPAMTDRNLVVLPDPPLLIPAGRRPKFYLSLPLMYQLYIGNSKKAFYEFFIEPLTTTWFGSNTRRGELCYEIDSPLLNDPDELPVIPHRINLELRLYNRDSEHLNVDKINLPAQFLPVYRVDGLHYWTNALTITNEKLTDELSLHYGKGVPCRHEQLQLVNEARLRSEARTIMRALEAIIG